MSGPGLFIIIVVLVGVVGGALYLMRRQLGALTQASAFRRRDVWEGQRKTNALIGIVLMVLGGGAFLLINPSQDLFERVFWPAITMVAVLVFGIVFYVRNRQ